MKNNIFLSVFLSSLAILNIPSCSTSNKPLVEQVQQALDENIIDYDVKGASAAIIMPGHDIWLGVSGISHDTVCMQPTMLFAIGSITKNVVAALTLKLAEEGMLSLDDPLSKWLPSYPNVDSTIVIRQLLNHTSGLYMFWENQKIWDDLIQYRTKVFSPEEVLSYLHEPHFPPGQGHRYSNTNYLLMAMIITRATGSSLSDEFRRRFWEPLELEHTYLSMEEQIPDSLAHVWGDNFENDGSFRDITFLPRASHESITYGSAGIFMTAEDLARWSHALFQGKVIAQSSLTEMLKFEGAGYHGLGVGRFGRGLSNGQEAIGHGGGNIGTTTFMVYLPEYETSLAVMINAFKSKCAEQIVEDLIEIVTDHLQAERHH